MIKQHAIVPGDRVFIDSDSWFDSGPCTIKEIEFFPDSTQVRILTTDGHKISTAYHFIEKIEKLD